MHIILGGTGHVGSAAASALLARNEPVTVVTRRAEHGEPWRKRGAEVAVVDVHDSDALREVFRKGRRAFLLNPPAPTSMDTDVEERKTVAAIVAALDGSGLEKVVAESTGGARPGERCGDLNVLYGLEQALAAQPIPASIIRAGYYYSNWDASLDTARDEGVVHTLFPVDFDLPMVAPEDLGEVAARLLTEPVDSTGLHYVEGPRRYSANDVAAAFAKALGKQVQAVATPREQWVDAFKQMGFSNAAAESYARMTQAVVDKPDAPESPVHCTITLEAYIADLVGRG